MNAELDGRKLDEMEFNFFFLLLLIAGNETTRTVTTNGMLALLEHPEQLRDLRNEPSLVPGAVEEILRFAPAVHTFRRTAHRATPRSRRRDPRERQARDLVSVGEPRRGSLRRSPTASTSAAARTSTSPSASASTTASGANLARLELQRDLPRHRRRGSTTWRLVSPPRRLRSNFINGVKEMRVRFRPGPPVS